MYACMYACMYVDKSTNQKLSLLAHFELQLLPLLLHLDQRLSSSLFDHQFSFTKRGLLSARVNCERVCIRWRARIYTYTYTIIYIYIYT
jgi:hypothetical protein